MRVNSSRRGVPGLRAPAGLLRRAIRPWKDWGPSRPGKDWGPLWLASLLKYLGRAELGLVRLLPSWPSRGCPRQVEVFRMCLPPPRYRGRFGRSKPHIARQRKEVEIQKAEEEEGHWRLQLGPRDTRQRVIRPQGRPPRFAAVPQSQFQRHVSEPLGATDSLGNGGHRRGHHRYGAGAARARHAVRKR